MQLLIYVVEQLSLLNLIQSGHFNIFQKLIIEKLNLNTKLLIRLT